jgi:hypothetical protein
MAGTPIDWHEAWAAGLTPWDLRASTPPLAALLERGAAQVGVRPGARVAVPGCGRGHDLRVFAAHGCAVTGFDLVPAAVDEARALLAFNRVTADVHCRDVLGLLPEFEATFDVVYDYTCYCALPLHLRDAYGRVAAGLLRPGGVCLHLTFPTRADVAGPAGRPPYVITPDDVRRSFGPHLELRTELPAEGSVGRRAGAEAWFVWQKRGGGA